MAINPRKRQKKLERQTAKRKEKKQLADASAAVRLSARPGHLRRGQAVFGHSRLYRQAEEGSRELFAAFSREEFPLRKALRAVAPDGVIDIRSQEDATSWLGLVRQFASRVCEPISPYRALPILAEAITEFYYGRANKQPAWAGTALKLAMALIAGHVYERQPFRSQSLDQLVNAVSAATLLDQVQIACSAYGVFAAEGDFFRLTADGFNRSEHLDFIHRQYRASFLDRGQVLRTAIDSVKAIWTKPIQAAEAVERVLRGEQPRDQEVFRGTLFHELSAENPPEFWAGIGARLKLAELGIRIRGQVTPNPVGITVFTTFGTLVSGSARSQLLQEAVRELFWEPAWYRKRVAECPSDMIVERPVVRVVPETDVFVTSLPMVADSLNWFVEASVLNYPDVGGVRLSDGTFRRLVSEPFERSVTELFRSFGFSAGQVTQSGSWMLPSGAVRLEHRYGEGIPGEVDVLAHHPGIGCVFVAECKVLRLPFNTRTMRNIAQKLGEMDGEAFFAKLRRKVEWVGAVTQFFAVGKDRFEGIVVLDRKVPGMVMAGGRRSCDLEILRDVLSACSR
jgi:hypothetical protein